MLKQFTAYENKPKVTKVYWCSSSGSGNIATDTTPYALKTYLNGYCEAAKLRLRA